MQHAALIISASTVTKNNYILHIAVVRGANILEGSNPINLKKLTCNMDVGCWVWLSVVCRVKFIASEN